MSRTDFPNAAHPDWPGLIARRDADGRDPEGWREALAHMDGCDACRRDALAADPTLVFRRLPSPAAADPDSTATDAAFDAATDADAMRRAVASLRRASRVAPAGRSTGDRPRRLGAGLRHLAAALLLVAAGSGTLFLAGVGPVDPGTGQDVPRVAANSADARPGVLRDEAGTSGGIWRPGAPSADRDAAGASPPVVEGLSAPRAADVYQTGEGDLTVVMVVDETLDI